jgi:glutamine synthetase
MQAPTSSLDFLRTIDQRGKIIATYIWTDGSMTLRSKNRTLEKKVTSVDELPGWNFDGSSCYMATTENSEIIIKPVAYFPDPFLGGDNILVLTETYTWEDNTYKKLVPANTNFRAFAREIFDACPDEEPWFGIEQEYTVLAENNRFTTRPYGWPSNGYPGNQGPYYCSVGGNVAFGRALNDAHYKCCLNAGVKISGTNAEVMPGQWEFQIGPCTGIEQGDHMTLARFLLNRCAEEFGLSISLEPKLFSDWNGSGCHTNFSTKTMRAGTGKMKYIDDMMVHFEKKHALHIELYGADNHKRLTGIHETSSLTKFSYGCGNRACSFRIPTQTMHDDGKGYIEDRRPASNICPYTVSAMVFDTGCNLGKGDGLVNHYKAWSKWMETASIEKP